MAVSGAVHDTPLADCAPAVSQSAVSIMTPDGWLVYRCKIGSRDEGQIMRVHGTNIHQYDDICAARDQNTRHTAWCVVSVWRSSTRSPW